MARKCNKSDLQSLPECARDFIKLVIRKMRYRKKVRADVQAELAAHFEDELRDCKTDEERQQRTQQIIEQFGDVKLLAVLLRRAKKRCRPLWRTIAARTFQTIGILIVYFILYCVYISTGQPTVKIDYIKEMTNLVRPHADESQNAAHLYNQAIALFKEPPEIEVEHKASMEPPSFSPQPPPIKKDLFSAIDEKKWIDELTEVELVALKQWIQENSEAIDLYIQASKRPYCWWHRNSDVDNLMGLLFPELRPMRDLSKLIGWQIKLKAQQGDIGGAFGDIFAVYRTGEHFKGPRTLIEQLVGIAIQNLAIRNAFQIIARTELNKEMLQHIQNEFQLLVDKAIFRVDFKTERFGFLDFIQRCYTDDGRGSGHMIPASLKKYFGQDDYLPEFDRYFHALGASLISPGREKMAKIVENAYDSFDERAKFTPWQLNQNCVDFEFDIYQWPLIKQIRYWPITLFLPAIGRACQLSYRIKADSEAFITVVALQRYQRENGRYPETLDILVQANLLKELPMDPFSNTTFVYRLEDNNFILYSLGHNFTDDGGKVHRDDEGEVRLWAYEGDAVFWPVPKSEIKQ